jgi:hypothetical protein
MVLKVCRYLHLNYRPSIDKKSSRDRDVSPSLAVIFFLKIFANFCFYFAVYLLLLLLVFLKLFRFPISVNICACYLPFLLLLLPLFLALFALAIKLIDFCVFTQAHK